MERLRKRDREYERRIAPEYVQRIAEAYRDFFFYYDETPLLVVNSSEVDFVAHSDELADLISEIRIDGAGSATLHTAWIQIMLRPQPEQHRTETECPGKRGS